MNILEYTIEYLMKYWNKDKEYVINAQIKKAESIKCSVETNAYEHMKKSRKVLTPLMKLTSILKGGFKSAELTELVGNPSSGKSQFCMALAIKNLERDINRKIIYIDTNNNFSLKRIDQFISSAYDDISKLNLLSRLFVLPIHSFKDFVTIINNLNQIHQKISPDILIIDSVAYYLRSMDDMLDRLHLSTKIIALLKEYAVDFDITIILTNQTTGMPGSLECNSALGSSWVHHVNTRLYFHMSDPAICNNPLTESCIARKIIVMKSPNAFNCRIPFQISDHSLIEL